MSKKSNKEKVNVFVDINKGVTAVVDAKDERHQRVIPFRGIDGIGEKYFIYNKNESNMLRWDIIQDFFPKYEKMTEQNKKELYNNIKKYIDVSVYYALQKYDNDNGYKTSKAEEYVKSVLKTLNKRSKNITDKQFMNREMDLKRKALKNAGISIMYLDSNLIGSKTTLIDKMRIMKNIKNTKGFVNVKKIKQNTELIKNGKLIKNNKFIENKRIIRKRDITGIKELKNRVFKSIKSKVQNVKKYFSKTSLVSWMKEKNESYRYNFTKKLIRTGAITLAGLSIFGFSNSINVDNVSDENLYAKETYNIVDKQKNIELEKNIEETSSYSMKEQHNDQNSEITENLKIENYKHNVQNNKKEDTNSKLDTEIVKVNNISSDEQDYKEVDISLSKENNKTMSVKDALMATLDIGFDSEFKISEGKYYENPDGTGNFGYYDNNLDTFKVSVLGTSKDGGYKPYYNDSKKSFYEIKKETDGILSYSIVSAKGVDVYGWNPVSENNIEECMVKSEIDRIKPYLSKEAIEFLKSDLSENIDISNNINILSQIKLAQNRANAEKKKSNDIEKDR